MKVVKACFIFVLLAAQGVFLNCYAAQMPKEQRQLIKNEIAQIPKEKLTDALFSAIHFDEYTDATPYAVQELIAAGAEINKTIDNGKDLQVNALGFVLLQDLMLPNRSSEEIIRILVKNGADVNADIHGFTHKTTNLELIERITQDLKRGKNLDKETKDLTAHYKRILKTMRKNKTARSSATIPDNKHNEESTASKETSERIKAAEALVLLRALTVSAERYKSVYAKYPDSFDGFDVEIPGEKQTDGSIVVNKFSFAAKKDKETLYLTATRKESGKPLYSLTMNAANKETFFQDLSGQHGGNIEDLTGIINN